MSSLARQFLHGRQLRFVDWRDAHLLKEQEELIQVLRYQRLAHKNSIRYARKFLRLLLEQIEDKDILPEIYEEYSSLINENDNASITREYTFQNGTMLRVTESLMMIQSGKTGLSTWEASYSLSEFILRNSVIFEDKCVLELGSGTGLAGFSCAQRYRTTNVILTDCDDGVLSLLDETRSRNGTRNVTVQKLDWRIASLEDNSLADVDVVMAADTLYDMESIPHFAKIVNFFIAKPKTAIAIVFYAMRNRTTYQFFFENLKNSDMKFRTFECSSGLDDTFFYHDYDVPIGFAIISSGFSDCSLDKIKLN